MVLKTYRASGPESLTFSVSPDDEDAPLPLAPLPEAAALAAAINFTEARSAAVGA